MGRSYCVIVPLHPEKRTHGGFYVRLPKHLKFDGDDWECGLHGLVYRHVWPPALVEPDTHMDLHLENGEKYRIPVELDANLTPEKLREAISKAGEHALSRFFNPPSTSPPPELSLTTTYDGSTSPPRPKREARVNEDDKTGPWYYQVEITPDDLKSRTEFKSPGTYRIREWFDKDMVRHKEIIPLSTQEPYESTQRSTSPTPSTSSKKSSQKKTIDRSFANFMRRVQNKLNEDNKHRSVGTQTEPEVVEYNDGEMREIFHSVGIDYMAEEQRFRVRIYSPKVLRVSFSTQLAMALGFGEYQEVMPDTISDWAPVMPFNNTHMLVISNVTEPNIVGEQMLPTISPLIPLNGGYGEVVHQQWENPLYCKVVPGEIQEMVMNVVSSDGRPVPLNSTVVLCIGFREVSNV